VALPEAAPLVAAVGWGATLVAVAVIAVRRRPVTAWAGISLVVVVGVACVATTVASSSASRNPPVLREAAEAGRSLQLLVRIDEKAREIAGTRAPWSSDGEPEPARVVVSGTALSAGAGARRTDLSAPVTVFLPASGHAPPALGSVIAVSGDIERAEAGERSSFLVFAWRSPGQAEPPPWYLSWAADLRTALIDRASTLPGDGGELLPGLAVGDTSSVGSDLDQAMKDSSLSHLTAVSGANCAVVVACASVVLGWLRAPRWVRVAGALAALAGFVLLVTPEPSVVRAALMATAVLISLARGHPSAGLPVLCLVVLGLHIVDPWMSRSYGFALSALATGGLLVLSGPIAGILGRWMPVPLAAALALPIPAQLACQPVLLMLDPALPLYGVVANLLAGPAAPAATMLGLVGCLLLSVAPPLATALMWLAWIPAAWIAGVAVTASRLPLARLPWLPGGTGVLLFAALTVIAVVWIEARAHSRSGLARLTGVVLVCAAVVYAGVLGGSALTERTATPSAWRIAACDVGQGDALLIRSAGRVAMVDTGPDPAPVRRCLDRLGIDRLDLLVLTHFDLDHIGGTEAVVGRVERTLAGVPENDVDERLLAALRAGGSAVEEASEGLSGALGTATWRVVWPRAGAKTMNTGNEGSVVLEVQDGGLRSIFLGDLDETAQDALLASGNVDGPVDVVKVAHHGSADQSEAFYDALRPRVALISVGAGNDYGHPAGSILDTLEDLGATIARTDRDGLVLVQNSDGHTSVWLERPATP